MKFLIQIGIIYCFPILVLCQKESKSIRNELPVKSAFTEETFAQNDFEITDFFLTKKRINDSVQVLEFCKKYDKMILNNEPDNHYFVTAINGKIISGLDLCKEDSISKIEGSIKMKDGSICEITLSINENKIFEQSQFKRSDTHIKINDGMAFDNDYFYLAKKENTDIINLHIYQYPSIFSNTLSKSINIKKFYEFFSTSSIYCEKYNNVEKQFVYIGFGKMENKSIFKDRVSYQYEYWIPYEEFKLFFKH